MAERVFVYGTLRRGAMHQIDAEHPGAKFVGTGHVAGKLWDLGRYPGIRLGGGNVPVKGDIFDVDAGTLVALDRYEGEQYRRVQVDVDLGNGRTARCWVYELAGEPRAGTPRIAGGDWLAGR